MSRSPQAIARRSASWYAASAASCSALICFARSAIAAALVRPALAGAHELSRRAGAVIPFAAVQERGKTLFLVTGKRSARAEPGVFELRLRQDDVVRDTDQEQVRPPGPSAGGGRC